MYVQAHIWTQKKQVYLVRMGLQCYRADCMTQSPVRYACNCHPAPATVAQTATSSWPQRQESLGEHIVCRQTHCYDHI